MTIFEMVHKVRSHWRKTLRLPQWTRVRFCNGKKYLFEKMCTSPLRQVQCFEGSVNALKWHSHMLFSKEILQRIVSQKIFLARFLPWNVHV